MNERTCAACGRRFQRARDLAEVKYCSKGCRGASRKLERALEAELLALLDERRPGASICPSEVARRRGAEWRDWMEPVRRAARRLAHRGAVEITQRGRVVDPSDFRGPVRVRRAQRVARA